MTISIYAEQFSVEVKEEFQQFLGKSGLNQQDVESVLGKISFPQTPEDVDRFPEKLRAFLSEASKEARASGDMAKTDAIGAAANELPTLFNLKKSEFMTRNFADLKLKASTAGVLEEDIKKLVDERNKSPGNFVVFERVMDKLNALMPQKTVENTQTESMQASTMPFDRATQVFEAFHNAQEPGSPYRQNTVIINNIGFNLFNNDFGINEKEAKLILANIEQLSAKLNNLHGEPNTHYEILQALSAIQRALIAQHPKLAPAVVSPQVKQATAVVPLVTESTPPTITPTIQASQASQGIVLSDSPPAVPTPPPQPPALQGVNGNPSVDTQEKYKKVLESAQLAVHANAKMEIKGNDCTIKIPETDKVITITGDPTNFKITGNDEVLIANVARLMAEKMKTPLNFMMGKDHEQNLKLLKALTLPDKGKGIKVNITAEQANTMREAFSKSPKDAEKLALLNAVINKQDSMPKVNPEREAPRPGR